MTDFLHLNTCFNASFFFSKLYPPLLTRASLSLSHARALWAWRFLWSRYTAAQLRNCYGRGVCIVVPGVLLLLEALSILLPLLPPRRSSPCCRRPGVLAPCPSPSPRGALPIDWPDRHLLVVEVTRLNSYFAFLSESLLIYRLDSHLDF